MKRTTLVLTTIGFCLILGSVGAQERKHRGFSISTEHGTDISDCGQIRIRLGDGETVRSSQQQIVPRSAISSLKVKSSERGGVHVHGWSRDEYAITACLAATGDTSNDAKTVLDQLKLSVQDGQVGVTGPPSRDWIAFLIIQAPNGAVLDLDSENGPIGVSELVGTVTAQNVNGPITFHKVTGQVHAGVQNGPITVSGSGGDYRLRAQNGPLTVELDGSQWSGGELVGHTQNGPLTLKLPEAYQSSVHVDASGHSPIECRAIQCRQAVRNWDRPNVIEFGDRPAVIRLSTVNGPVTIAPPGGKR